MKGNRHHGPGSVLTDKESVDGRKFILEALNKAYSSKVQWLPVETFKTSVSRPKICMNALLRLGLIETKKEGDKTVARINYDGQQALLRSNFTYRSLQRSILIPAATMVRLEKIARDLGVVKATGIGAGERASVSGLIRLILGREDAFVRWMKAQYPVEGEGEGKE